MEKFTRFFATETDSGKDTSLLIVDQPHRSRSRMTSEMSDSKRLATSGRVSLSGSEVFASEATYPTSNGLNDVGRIAIKVKGTVLFVNPLEVVAATAQGNYVALLYRTRSYLVRETMATAEHKLKKVGFVRIHRSILVNANLVKDLRRDDTGTYVLRMTDGKEHPVGRAYRDNLKVIAKSWLGVDFV
jgi:DNA-binding LytR/AlgR family response regulator